MKPIQDLVGVWRLHEYQITDMAGRKLPSGEGFKGVLIYGEEGCVSVLIRRESGPTVDGVEQNAMSYFGRYEKTSENELVHIVEIANPVKFEGTFQRRHLRWDGEMLCLSTVDRTDGVHTVVWKRVSLF